MRLAESSKASDTDLIWQRVVDETARHYLALYPDISSSPEYQIIGAKMTTLYPSLKRRTSPDSAEWVSWNDLNVFIAVS